MTATEQIYAVLIEDNPGDVGLIRAFVGSSVEPTIRLTHAPRLDTGLRLLDERPADVVLLDLGLPDSIGLDTYRRVRAHLPHTPIVVLSAIDVIDEAMQAVREGAADYLYKGSMDPALLVRTVNRATQGQRFKKALSESETRYRSLFEDSPVPLCEEDLSGVKLLLDELAASGVEDVHRHLAEHPEFVARCTRAARVVEVNVAMLRLYEAESREDLRSHLLSQTDKRSLDAFRHELAAISEGKTHFECETIVRTMSGQHREIIVRWSTAPGSEATLSRVWVSLIDLTERNRANRTLRANHSQLMAAQEIQRHLLPTAPPDLPGFDFAALLIPAEYAAGDYFDFLKMDDGCVGVAIGDVAGHGFAAALLMASVHALIRVVAATTSDLAEILTIANRLYVEITEDERFVTMLLGRIHPISREFTYASAAHPTGYVLDRAGNVKKQLRSTNLPLGVSPDAKYVAGSTVVLDEGDVVVMVTDGFHETQSSDGAFFGLDRVLDVVRRSRDQSAQEIVEELRSAVCEFSRLESPMDDITALVFRVVESDSSIIADSTVRHGESQ